METGKYSSYRKPNPKKKGPYYTVRDGINKDFLTQVNEKLSKLPNMSQSVRENYVNELIQIRISLKFYSPIYFASAISFLHDYKDGPNEENFNDEAVQTYVSPLMIDFGESTIPKTVLNLRRKIEFLRYIRLLESIRNSEM